MVLKPQNHHFLRSRLPSLTRSRSPQSLRSDRKSLTGNPMTPPSFLRRCVILAVTAAITSLAGAASHYKVGDAQGWRLPDLHEADMYATWADNYVFRVDDSIVFDYKNDSVARVSKTGYYHCNETADGAPPKDGSRVFVLDEPGFYYFVSGEVEHCRRGQRVMIEAIGSGPTPSPAIAAAGPSPSSIPNAAAAWRRIASVEDLAARFGALVITLAYRWM